MLSSVSSTGGTHSAFTTTHEGDRSSGRSDAERGRRRRQPNRGNSDPRDCFKRTSRGLALLCGGLARTAVGGMLGAAQGGVSGTGAQILNSTSHTHYNANGAYKGGLYGGLGWGVIFGAGWAITNFLEPSILEDIRKRVTTNLDGRTVACVLAVFGGVLVQLTGNGVLKDLDDSDALTHAHAARASMVGGAVLWGTVWVLTLALQLCLQCSASDCDGSSRSRSSRNDSYSNSGSGDDSDS